MKMTIEQLAKAIKARDPRLAQVPDVELVRKVLERRPDMISMVETSQPRAPMKGSTDWEQLWNLIKQSLTTGARYGKIADRMTYSDFMTPEERQKYGYSEKPSEIKIPTPQPPPNWWKGGQ